MTPTTLLGFAAATLTTAAFIPQAHKMWRSGRSDDLSLGMVGLFTVGIGLWLGYGILERDLPLIVANSITLVLNLAILGQALAHRRR